MLLTARPRPERRPALALPLEGIRVLDFTWMNAGAKGTRHLSLYGAELIHLEWKGKLDNLRKAPPFHTAPGEEFEGAGTAGYTQLNVPTVNRSASFNNNHVGKWGVSLNLRHPKGQDIFRQLVEKSDVVCDNFTARTLEGWGFGFPELEKINPRIICVQAPGFGHSGPYVDYRSYGPTAAAMSGLTWLSGLPDRYPCGYGFSYMDVCGPYFNAMAVMAALRQRDRTGKGVWVDLSQSGPAFLLTGTAMLDWSANGRRYERSGNRSVYTKSAPHGAYRCDGDEAWIAIDCSTQEHWEALLAVMGHPEWASQAGFRTLDERYVNQDSLDRHVEDWTLGFERYDLMARLQQAGVPAGACQNTKDRFEIDPQLKHKGYFAQMPHSEVAPYPVEGHHSRFSETQPSPLGNTGWGTAMYGEHNTQVYGRLLGLGEEDLAALAQEDVI